MKTALMRGVGMAVFTFGWMALGIGLARADGAGQAYSLAAAGNNAFALDLYGRLKDRDGGTANLFYSPYSISSALSMVCAGARGRTEWEMQTALRFPMPLVQERDRLESDDLSLIETSYAALNKSLSGDWQQQGFTLSVANSLWGQKGEPFLPDYLDVVKKDFGGELTPVDFITQADAARRQINTWVADKTHNKITDLLAPGTVTPDSRLILANAIYFKGAWMEPFDAKNTVKADFHTRKGDLIQAEMMHSKNSIGYAEDDVCQMVELPYNGGQLAMIVLLPKPHDAASYGRDIPDPLKIGMMRLESAFTPEYVAKLSGKLVNRPVNLALPKWETTQSVSLGEELQAMGMKQAFTASADFSGIDGRTDLFISGVIHKAYVKVDEKGTEAAGATAIAMLGAAMRANPPPPVDFTADHSFIYLIVSQQTNAILFAGRLCDPMAGK